MQTSDFKSAIADCIIDHVCPIGDRTRALLSSNNGELDQVLHQGAVAATAAAEVTMQEVRRLVGTK
jgi:hypothetical protein